MTTKEDNNKTSALETELRERIHRNWIVTQDNSHVVIYRRGLKKLLKKARDAKHKKELREGWYVAVMPKVETLCNKLLREGYACSLMEGKVKIRVDLKEEKPKATTVQNIRETTRLTVGDVIFAFNEEQLVWFCNDCRAAIVPVARKGTLHAHQTPEWVKFTCTGPTENISPNSECKLIRRLGVKGLIEFLQQKQQTRPKDTMKKDKKNKNTETTSKSSKTESGTRGSLGEHKGCSIVSVIRLMGNKGWNVARAAKALEALGVKASIFTVRRQIFVGQSCPADQLAELSSKDFAELERLSPPIEKAKKEKKAKKDGDQEGNDEAGETPKKKIKKLKKSKKSKQPVEEKETETDEDEEEV